MRIPRFYLKGSLEINTEVDLPASVHQHAVQVLRLKVGAPLIVFNGQGGEYHAHISHLAKRHSRITITHFDPVNRESKLHITWVQSLIKTDKMDFALQKCTELGVSNIQPIITERSVLRMNTKRLEKKFQHWQGVIQNACEQSGRTQLPQLSTLLTLEAYLSASEAFCLCLHPDKRAKPLTHLHQDFIDKHANHTSQLAFIIGPEGGLSATDLVLCEKYNCLNIQLGARILRAETAAIAVMTLLQAQCGDL